MTLHYEFTFDDWVEFNRYHLRHSPAHQRMRLIVRLIFIPVALVFAGLQWMHGDEVLSLLIAFAIVAVLWFFLYPILFDRRVLRSLKRILNEGNNKGLLGPHTFTTSTDGYRVIYPGGEAFHKWSSVEKLASTEAYIFIYVSSLQATVIPRRALEGGSFEAVLAEIKTHLP